VTEQQVFGVESAIGLQLADPVPVRGLNREKVTLGAPDGVLEGRHER
jgi:hypothetical protein